MITGKLIKHFIKSFFKKELTFVLSNDETIFLLDSLFSLKKKATKKDSQEYTNSFKVSYLDSISLEEDFSLVLDANKKFNTPSFKQQFSSIISKDTPTLLLAESSDSQSSNNYTNDCLNTDKVIYEIISRLDKTLLFDMSLEFNINIEKPIENKKIIEKDFSIFEKLLGDFLNGSFLNKEDSKNMFKKHLPFTNKWIKNF